MTSKKGRTVSTTLLTAALILSAKPAIAQWSSSAIGVAEYDTKKTLLLLAGLSAHPARMGVAPLIGVQGYYLTYDVVGTKTNVWVAKPYVGLINSYTGGSVDGSIGYAFSNTEKNAL